jgi:hypothetical protein
VACRPGIARIDEAKSSTALCAGNTSVAEPVASVWAVNAGFT